jgi:hypothetical protein
MKQFRKYILFALLIVIPVLGFSQRWKLQRAEISGGIGGVNYFGDIGGTADESNWFGLKDLEINYTRPNMNIGGRYRINDIMNVKANIIFGYLEGSDEGSRNEARNYAFSSSVLEISGQYEYSIIPESAPLNFSLGNLRRGLRSASANLNTYVFAGLGAVFFDVKPLADLDGSNRFESNKSMSLVFPAGVGIKYPIARQLHLGLEIGGRFATSDYLDGFTSEFSNSTDIYYFSLLYVVYKINTSNRRLFNF